MSDLLAIHAARHFAASPRESLLGALRLDGDRETVLTALSTRSRALKEWAARQLAHFARDDGFVELALKGIDRPDARAGMLAALSFVRLPRDAELLAAMRRALDDPDSAVAESAARAIAFRRPDRAEILLPCLAGPHAALIARQLCLSERAEFVPTLCRHYDVPANRPSPVLGVLVTPEWLVANAEAHRDDVRFLAVECGYTEAPPCDRTLELLASGFHFVGDAMRAAADADTDAWRARVMALLWELVPEDAAVTRRAEPVRIDNPLDVALFFAALREADRMSLPERKDRNPFDRHARLGPPGLVCCHANAGFVRRQFFECPLGIAREEGIPASDHGRFLIEYARIQLDPNEDTRTEADLYLLARRAVSSRIGGGTEVLRARFPVREYDDFPAAARLAVPAFRPVAPPESLSPGAASVVALLVQAGFDVDAATVALHAQEDAWRRVLPPLGVELQTPLVDPARSLAWKQVFRGCGVPSPRRPEFRRMVEAAFRPAFSFHAAALAPLVLWKLGLFAEPQDLALHLSIQGELGDDVSYIAFPAMFIGRRLVRRAPAASTRVMSKGLVNLNHDVETVRNDLPATCRTELRVFRCIADQVVDIDDQTGYTIDARPASVAADGAISAVPITLDPEYIDDIVTTHVLATACLPDSPIPRSLWSAYTRSVDTFVSTLPPEFGEFLRANFHESTGDAWDASLLDLVPVHRLRMRVREVLQRERLSDRCRAELRRLRTAAVTEIAAALARAAGLERLDRPLAAAAPEECFPTAAGPVWIPASLQTGLSAAPLPESAL